MDLYKAIRASIAIPVVFKPIIIDGKRLVDGGVTNNLPIDVLRKMGARRIVGVDLGYNGQLRSDVDNIIEIGSQALDIMAYQITSFKSYGADYILRPGIDVYKRQRHNGVQRNARKRPRTSRYSSGFRGSGLFKQGSKKDAQ